MTGKRSRAKRSGSMRIQKNERKCSGGGVILLIMVFTNEDTGQTLSDTFQTCAVHCISILPQKKRVNIFKIHIYIWTEVGDKTDTLPSKCPLHSQLKISTFFYIAVKRQYCVIKWDLLSEEKIQILVLIWHLVDDPESLTRMVFSCFL